MIIAHNQTEGRVEVSFGSQRNEDGTVTITKRTTTTPLTGSKTMWSKTVRTEEDLFTVEADLIPSLLAALGVSLTLAVGDYA